MKATLTAGAARGILFLASLVMVPAADAHLMNPGHGTLNIVKQKVYIVLSLPVSVFSDGAAAPAVADGILTGQELGTFGNALRRRIRDHFLIRHKENRVEFSSLLLNLPKGDHHVTGRSRSVTVLGVARLDGTYRSTDPIEITTTLLGSAPARLKLQATMTRAGQTIRTETFEFTPTNTRHRFFVQPESKRGP